MVRETETEVPHEQALRGGDTFLLQESCDVSLTDGDGTAQPPFAQTVCALTAAERQQLRIRAGRDLEDSAGQVVELQRRNNIIFVHQLIALFCHTRHLPAFCWFEYIIVWHVNPSKLRLFCDLTVHFSLVGIRSSTLGNLSRKG